MHYNPHWRTGSSSTAVLSSSRGQWILQALLHPLNYCHQHLAFPEIPNNGAVGVGISAGWKWNLASIKKREREREKQEGDIGFMSYTLFNLQACIILMTTKCLELAPAPGLSLFHSHVTTNTILVQVQMYSVGFFFQFSLAEWNRRGSVVGKYSFLLCSGLQMHYKLLLPWKVL